jgi:hypothetical protein
LRKQPSCESRRNIDRFFESTTDLLDILEEEAWSQVEEDLLKELGRVEDVGHWLEAWVWRIGEPELDVVAHDAFVVANPCLCDVPLPDNASGSERHSRSIGGAVRCHVLTMAVAFSYSDVFERSS